MTDVTCARCGKDILSHIEIQFIGCLSALSGEIDVLREYLKSQKIKSGSEMEN